MEKQITYRFAETDEGNLVDVFLLTEKDRRDYICPSCRTILRPVFPSKKRKHFRHKSTVMCSEETYLHRIGKLLLYRVYQDCVLDSVPFTIEYWRPRECNACKEHGPCTIIPEIKEYDLTKSFKEIKLEKTDQSFIPDLLLLNSSKEKIYFEIAVTHESSTEKKESGIRIIELSLESQDDLSVIESRNLKIVDGKYKVYNFRPSITRRDFSKECPNSISVFILHKRGKSTIVNMKPLSFERMVESKKAYVERVRSSDSEEEFIQQLENAYRKGKKVMNCFLCRYHAIPSVYQIDELNHNVYCKFKRFSCNSNYAHDCEAYRIDTKVFRYE